MKQLRTFTHENGKKVILAWIQNRCCKCGRFLKKHYRKYCLDCWKKETSKRASNWSSNNKERKKSYNHNYSITHREEANIKQREYRRRKSLIV